MAAVPSPLAVRLLRQRTVPQSFVEAALARAVQERTSFVEAALTADVSGFSPQIEAQLASNPCPLEPEPRPAPELLWALPAGMARRLLAIPLRHHPALGVVDIALVDPFDQHAAEELSFHLRCRVKVCRAPYAAVRSAIESTGASLDQEQLREEVAPESAIPLVRRSLPPLPIAATASPVEPAARAVTVEPLTRIRLASTAQEVAVALAEAGHALRCDVVVFARRGSAYQAQAASFALGPEQAHALEIPGAEPSVLRAAAEKGFYFGSLPDTVIHLGLRESVPSSAQGEVYAVPVKLGERLLLVMFLAGFEESYAVTQRADALAQAASAVLKGILLQRRPGGA
jgi:hypothetical protein